MPTKETELVEDALDRIASKLAIGARVDGYDAISVEHGAKFIRELKVRVAKTISSLACAQVQRDTALEACRGVERKYLVTAAAVLRCQEAARMTPADAESVAVERET